MNFTIRLVQKKNRKQKRNTGLFNWHTLPKTSGIFSTQFQLSAIIQTMIQSISGFLCIFLYKRVEKNAEKKCPNWCRPYWFILDLKSSRAGSEVMFWNSRAGGNEDRSSNRDFYIKFLHNAENKTNTRKDR